MKIRHVRSREERRKLDERSGEERREGERDMAEPGSDKRLHFPASEWKMKGWDSERAGGRVHAHFWVQASLCHGRV